ncbi:MAG: B12-binding domain-containing radical SAM protein [Phycisphaerae bacterium]
MTSRRHALQPEVVLVADRTLSGNYQVLFEGIFATMQTTETPGLLWRKLLSPKLPVDGQGRARVAPLGIRRIEAALRNRLGLSAWQVACASPESVGSLLGPWTKLVCVSSSDPLGEGMSNTTTKVFCGGQLYTKKLTGRMMQQIRTAKEKHGFAVLFGGAGAWQYRRSPQVAAAHGIDCVFEGYFEDRGPQIVSDVLAGKRPPAYASEPTTCAPAVESILAPSVMGSVELSRGCGKGCSFCVAGPMKMQHVEPKTILADIETNLAGGVSNVVSSSEDFFRYGANGPKVNFDALHDLLSRMRRLEGLRFMQIDHGNISSVAQLDDEQLTEIRRLLSWDAQTDGLWVNLGVESASGRLVAATGAGKIAPFSADDWPELVYESVAKLDRCGFFPVVSLVLGLEGETPDDVAATARLVERLAEMRVVIFPVFHEPLAGDGAFHLGRMRPDQLELFRTCYELNFRRVPGLYCDNQRAGGVRWSKRALVQLLGRGEVWLWRRRFARMSRRIGASAETRPGPEPSPESSSA